MPSGSAYTFKLAVGRISIGVVLCAIASACTGTVEPTPSGSNTGGAAGYPWGGAGGAAGTNGEGLAGGDPSINALTCTTPSVGPTPLRRLTHTEYDNAVRDLLGDTTRPASAFAADTQVGLFDNTVSAQTVPVLLTEQYLDAAVDLAQNVTDVNALIRCDASDANCARAFVQRFGRRAYRRPLTTSETDDLMALYTETRDASDASTGVRATIAAMLASPAFLFRPEFGAAPSSLAGAMQLSGFEIAARLASLLWASVPDDGLLDAAQNGQLETREQVAGHARRMLMDERAHAAIRSFYEQWLGLPLLDSAVKDPAIYPLFTDELREAMREETRRFIDHVLWQDDARLTTLLTAPYSFVNGPLAQVYGVAPPSDPNAFAQTPMDTAQRLGVLTHGSLMSTFASPSDSSPIKRGKLVRVRMLCQNLPDPPPNIPAPPEPQEGLSTRERFAMHTNNIACRGCHNLIDGLGFGLEHYDGIGAFRTIDHGVTVDASGQINTTRDIDSLYEGGPELAQRLASSAQVRDCVPTQWLRYAMGRNETTDDTCSVIALRDAFAASGGDLRELMVAITQTDAFWNYRQPL